MKKRVSLLLVVAITSFSLPSAIRGMAPKGKHIVQSHISQLDAQLKNANLTYEERTHLEAHLRRFFDNEMYGKHRAVKNLSNPAVQAIANSIKSSYNEILKTPGDHKNAARNFAQQATGLVALYVKPEKYQKKNKAVKASRAEEARKKPSKGKSSTVPGRLSGPIAGTAGTLATAKSATTPTSLTTPKTTATKTTAPSKATTLKNAAKKDSLMNDKTKNTAAPEKKRMRRAAPRDKKNYTSEAEAKKAHDEKKARKLKKKKMRADAASKKLTEVK